MEIIKAIILGTVQGLTEFLPISSSGHLVIGQQLLDFNEQGIAFEVFVHLGTLLAVVIFFRQDIIAMLRAPLAMIQGKADSETRKYFLWDLYIILATLPAVVVGLFFKDQIEQFFTNIFLVYCMLACTGVMMILSRKMVDRGATLNGWRAFLVGCAQALAILPGLSRSGTTIFAGMAMGVNRVTVARFSFIMSIPAILGAAVLQSRELIASPPAMSSMMTIGAGTIFSAISGYFAIIFLMDLVKKNRLQWFGYYCLCVSFIGVVTHLLG